MAGAGDLVERAWRVHRRRVFDLAYRMLGSVADAEDVMQEAYVRLTKASVQAIDDVEGWLVTVTARLCLDHLRSARVRRTTYVGPWLPEPLVATTEDPVNRVTFDDSIRMALMVALEQLSPAERAVFVLHDVFAIPFAEVAGIVGRTPPACRQLASRARRRLHGADDATARGAEDQGEVRLVVARFAAACESGRLDELLAVLDPSVTGEFDSGGAVPGPRRPVVGAHTLASILRSVFGGSGARFLVDDVNGEPGVVVRIGQHVVAVAAVGVRDRRVVDLHAVGNPAKLAHLNRG